MSPIHTVGGHRYQIGRLDAFQQFHLARSLYAVLIAMGTLENAAAEASDKARAEAKPGEPVPPPPGREESAKAMCSTMGGLDKREVDDAVAICLNKVAREQPGGAFAPVYPNGVLMFSDIGLQALMELVYLVLKENELIGFFVPPRAASQTQPTTN